MPLCVIKCKKYYLRKSVNTLVQDIWALYSILQENTVHIFFYFIVLTDFLVVPSVLWHSWLGNRKGIRPVKKLSGGCWHCYLSGLRCNSHTIIQMMPLRPTVTCFSKILIGLTFSYWLSRVLLDKGPLDRFCSCCILIFLYKKVITSNVKIKVSHSSVESRQGVHRFSLGQWASKLIYHTASSYARPVWRQACGLYRETLGRFIGDVVVVV